MAKARALVEGVKKGAGLLGDGFDELYRYAENAFDPRYNLGSRKMGEVAKPDTSVVAPVRAKERLAIQDLEGRPYLSTMSDRSAAGGILEGIGGKPLAHGVDLTGGQDYMLYNPDMWASGDTPTKTMLKAAKELKDKYGVDPLFMPWRMPPSGGDFAHMTGQAMLSFNAKYLSKSAKKELDKNIKKMMPDWVGIDSPESLKQFSQISDKNRKELLFHMDKTYRNQGGLSLPQARLAVSDQSQVKGIDFGFQNVGVIDVEKGLNPKGGNASYPTSVGGKYLGTLDQGENIPTLLDLNPERLGKALNKDGTFSSGPATGPDYLADKTGQTYSAILNPYGGIIDEKLLRDLSDKGFKIDSNGYMTAAATGLGLLGMSASDDSEAGVVGVVKRLIEAGYPESTAMKIATGELPMDYASRMARAKEQGFTEKAYHTGKNADNPQGILSLNPPSSKNTGTFLSGIPELTASYTGPINSRPTSYPMLVNTRGMEKTDADGANWNDIFSPVIEGPDGKQVMEVFEDDMYPSALRTDSTVEGVSGSFKEPLYQDDYVTTNELARGSKERGATGAVIDNVIDVGPNQRAFNRAIKSSNPHEYPHEWIQDYERKGGKIISVQDGSQARSELGAAFDPDQIGSTNILASNPAATLGALLFGGGIGQEAQGLAAHAQGNTDAYLTAEEKAYRDGRKEFDNFFADDTGYDRADLLPFRVNEETGETEFAAPEMIKGLLSAFYDYGQLPKSGILNPQSLEEMI